MICLLMAVVICVLVVWNNYDMSSVPVVTCGCVSVE